MIKPHKTPNAYDFFGVRKLKYCAPHLEYISIPFNYNIEQAIQKWIETNLKKRYYIGKTVDINKDNALENCVKVGFEDPKELSYFVLACPLLKYK